MHQTTHDSLSRRPATTPRYSLPSLRFVIHLLVSEALALRLFSYRGADANPMRVTFWGSDRLLCRSESQVNHLPSSQSADRRAAAADSCAFRGLVGRAPQAIRESRNSGLSDRRASRARLVPEDGDMHHRGPRR